MAEKTRLTPQLADATYAHTLVIKSTHEYKVHGPLKLSVAPPLYPWVAATIGCVGKLGGQSGFPRHCLLILVVMKCSKNIAHIQPELFVVLFIAFIPAHTKEDFLKSYSGTIDEIICLPEMMQRAISYVSPF